MKLRKKHLFAVIVAMVAISGVGLFSLAYGSENGSTSNSQEDSNEPTASEGDLPFYAEPLTDTAFIATIEGTSSGDPVNATMEYDGNGNSQFAGEYNGQGQKFIIVSGTTYSCNDDECIRFDNSAITNPLYNPADYIYTESDIEELLPLASYLGQRHCAAGTCDVWEITSETGELSNVYVGTDDNRISEITSTSVDSEYMITYEYRDITITPPEGAETLPGF